MGMAGEVVIGSGETETVPKAYAGANSYVTEGDTVQFSGVGTVINGTIVLYEWDFNDDGLYEWSSEENGMATYIYNDRGTYKAVLRVTDDKGLKSTDFRHITVSKKSDGSSVSSLPFLGLIMAISTLGIIAISRRRRLP
jgi:PKD repeat protein